MLLDDKIFNLWLEHISRTSSVNQYRPKVTRYFEKNSNIDIKESLDEKRLSEFIFNDDGNSAMQKYSAMQNFYLYIYQHILKIDECIFPIKHSKAKEADKEREFETKRKKYSTVYLEDDFDFTELFDDKYYNHLNNDVATITIKAVVSCALATGFGTGELLKDYNKVNYLTINDVKIVNNNQIEITCNNINVDKIILDEEISKYIIEYINFRNIGEEKTWGKRNSEGEEAFFIKLWEGRKLDIDWSIWDQKSKPCTIFELVSYMFKYICSKLEIEKITLIDIRANIVYHQLLATKGSALHEIIKLHGFDPFVEEAYKRFISKYEIGESAGFDFFNKTSLPKLNNSNIDNEVIPETYMTEEEKRKRNHKIVRELKTLYKNKCQVCGQTIDMGYGTMYSEVHHIQPLGNEHNGTDSKSNMLLLCPNHHKMFDLGVLAIDPTDCKTLLHINSNDKFNGKIIFKHLVSSICIRYGYEHIYLSRLNRN